MLRVLGDPSFKTSEKTPLLMFGDFPPLQEFTQEDTNAKKCLESVERSLSLASLYKAFGGTHYREMRFVSEASETLLPFGPKFHYYDSVHKVWVTDLADTLPSYEHLLGSWLPASLDDPYQTVEQFAAKATYQPTSYEIAGSGPKCPMNISIHEFSAYQRVLSARARRWLVIAVELGATNINFGSPQAMRFLNHLAVQAGPSQREEGWRREAHAVFEEPTFCQQLYDQISRRLDSIQKKWREVHCASVLITFSLRLFQLCHQDFRETARNLLSRIRRILSDWIIFLRRELRNTEDAEIAEKASEHSLWASLLCRQTFTVLADDARYGTSPALSKDELLCYLRASIALQENIRTDLALLPGPLKMLLGRDMCDAYAMREITDKLIHEDQYDMLERAINETWSCDGHTRLYDDWMVVVDNGQHWLATTVRGHGSQVVHYHTVQGHLLIDHEPLGRLPLKMSQDRGIRELFGHRQLLTRPSGIPGMRYQLVAAINRHEIHFGQKGDQVVIQAYCDNAHLQFIPPDCLQPPSQPRELPSTLVDDCVHWLNLHTGELEMRRKPDI